jgi:hypothetical protein
MSIRNRGSRKTPSLSPPTPKLQVKASPSPSTRITAGGTQRLAINQNLLLSDVPCNGDNLSISASVFRSDKDDFVPTVINMLTNAKQDPALTTYAASAIPGIQLAGIVAGDLYNTFFPEHGTKIIDTKLATLKPGATGKNLLRDFYMLQCKRTDNMSGDALDLATNHPFE